MNQWNLQVAVRARLLGSAALKAFVGIVDEDGEDAGARIYDDVPQETPFPYVVIGDDTSSPWDQDACLGAESTITLHTWSRYSGRKETKLMMQAIYDAMHRKELAIAGAHNVICEAEFQDSFLDPDGETRHGVIRFRLLTNHP